MVASAKMDSDSMLRPEIANRLTTVQGMKIVVRAKNAYQTENAVTIHVLMGIFQVISQENAVLRYAIAIILHVLLDTFA